MSNKVVLEIICPYCKSKLMLRKLAEVATKNVTCPNKNCGKELHLAFDVAQDPQTYRLLGAEGENEPRNTKKTVYGAKDGSGEEAENEPQKKKTVYGRDRNKTPHNAFNDIDDDDDDEEARPKPKKRHRLRDRIYLTHITWFGLRNHRFQLYEGTTTIGRYDEDDTSDIMIRGDEAMSRKSVEIIIEEEEGVFDYKLKVLNATNKVKVNDRTIKVGSEVYLDFGDIILLGNSKFKFDNH